MFEEDPAEDENPVEDPTEFENPEDNPDEGEKPEDDPSELENPEDDPPAVDGKLDGLNLNRKCCNLFFLNEALNSYLIITEDLPMASIMGILGCHNYPTMKIIIF